jgi:hypothetical protein
VLLVSCEDCTDGRAAFLACGAACALLVLSVVLVSGSEDPDSVEAARR